MSEFDDKKKQMDESQTERVEQILRKMTDDVEIPESLEPNAVESKLKARQKAKKKTFVRRYAGIAAAACICLVVGAASVMHMNESEKSVKDVGKLQREASKTEIMRTAENYEQLGEYMEAYNQAMKAEGDAGVIQNEKGAVMESAMDVGGDGAADRMSGLDYSDTNVREDGVGEGDTVKTDGKNLYILNGQTIHIVDASDNSLEEYGNITVEDEYYIQEIYVQDNRLAVFYTRTQMDENAEDPMLTYQDFAGAIVYDVSNPASPEKMGEVSQSGQYHTVRIKDGYAYLLSDYYPYYTEASALENYVPYVQGEMMKAADIYVPQGSIGSKYTVITSFSLNDPTAKPDRKAVLGSNNMCYVSNENIYLTELYYGESESEVIRTAVKKLSYKDGALEAVAQTKIDGEIMDSFCIDEYNGNLRIVATVRPNDYNRGVMPLIMSDMVVESEEEAIPTSTSLYMMDDQLEIVGQIADLAPEEKVYSARFMGETGYFVTFKEIDPLFSADLSDPHNPKIIGELKIPGFSDYLHPYGEGKLLGIGMSVDEKEMITEGVKLSMFNISDPSNVKEEHVTVLDSVHSTDAGYNYKAIFADTEKNLFGFMGYGDEIKYYMYSYDETEGFKEVFSKEMINYGNVRGMYVEDRFYLVANNTVEVFTLDGFEKLDDIVL